MSSEKPFLKQPEWGLSSDLETHPGNPQGLELSGNKPVLDHEPGAPGLLEE